MHFSFSSQFGSPLLEYSGAMRMTVLPASLNSVETTRFASAVDTAKETSVGGTSIFSKVPDMESLPPIDAQESSSCARYAPSSAENGLPQRLGLFCVRSKYSWKVSQHYLRVPPAAITFATDSMTA